MKIKIEKVAFSNFRISNSGADLYEYRNEEYIKKILVECFGTTDVFADPMSFVMQRDLFFVVMKFSDRIGYFLPKPGFDPFKPKPEPLFAPPQPRKKLNHTRTVLHALKQYNRNSLSFIPALFKFL